jgi:hypothetical protein
MNTVTYTINQQIDQIKQDTFPNIKRFDQDKK